MNFCTVYIFATEKVSKLVSAHSVNLILSSEVSKKKEKALNAHFIITSKYFLNNIHRKRIHSFYVSWDVLSILKMHHSIDFLKTSLPVLLKRNKIKNIRKEVH